MKEKINHIVVNIKNTLKGLYQKALEVLKKAPNHYVNSPFKTKRKHVRRINFKRLIPFSAATVIVIVLLFILFAPPKEVKDVAGTSVVAAAQHSAEVSESIIPESITPQENNTEQPTPNKEENKKEEGKKEETEVKSLAPNTHSQKVIEMQEKLMDLDYMEPDEPTDFYGPQTQYSIQLFQRKHNLQVDGIAGETTLKLLLSKDAKPYTVFLGERGTDVKELQSRLIELGYLKGKPTGLFGTDTENAVKAFQKRNDLNVDGNVGSNTRESIYSEDAKEAAKPKKKVVVPPKKKQPSTSKVPNDQSVSSLIAFAKEQLGEPYVRGGKGPGEFDCSGFVYYCLKSIGVKIGYMTSAGWAKSSWPIVTSMKDLLAGDILCFRGHVGIYLGGGQMIDASSGQGKIRITGNIFGSKYWTRYFRCARRVL